jgi:hypothetical protein
VNQGEVEIKVEAGIEGTMAEAIRTLEDGRGDRHLAIGHR